jgi:toxin ParE1/3/4
VSRGVRKAPQAYRDLDEIAAFIGRDNPQAAVRFLDDLEGRFHLLASSPGIGRPRPELGAGVRGFPAGDYLIFYRQLGLGIEVIRVLHGARDIEAVWQDAAGEGPES